jgi:uncharacterized protein
LTALHSFTCKGYEAIAKSLVEAGANLDIQCSEGRTALHWALVKGYDNIAKVLVEAGAKLDMKDN